MYYVFCHLIANIIMNCFVDQKYHIIVWHFDNAKNVDCLFSSCFQIISLKLLCRHVNKFYSMLRTLNFPLVLSPSPELSYTLNSFHMQSKSSDNDYDYAAPPSVGAVSFTPLLSMAKIFWFGICKYGHVCYYTKYICVYVCISLLWLCLCAALSVLQQIDFCILSFEIMAHAIHTQIDLYLSVCMWLVKFEFISNFCITFAILIKSVYGNCFS